jgi:prolipoprotein diacylglyceryl transferase
VVAEPQPVPGARSLRVRLNGALDTIVRREIVVVRRPVDLYFASVHTGVAVGTGTIFALATQTPVSLPLLAGLVGMIAAVSLLLFKGTKLLRRPHPWLSWAKKGVYHFQIVALACTVATLELAGEPVLTYLDVLVVGMLVYQAFGRIGCLTAGCCHGRPSSWGIRYGPRHAATGYVYFVQGVRLFPVQLVEALWLAALAAGSVAVFLADGRAGTNVALYVVGYGAGRFVLEFVRGDPGRVYVHGFSEPQWTALVLSAGVVVLELADVFPFSWAHVAVVAAMTLVVGTIVAAARIRRTTVGELLRSSDARRIERTTEHVLREARLVQTPPRTAGGADDGVLWLPRGRPR